jgi:hypothetical protein
MTIDAEDRVLVAGRGSVRALVDDDCDGRADRAIVQTAADATVRIAGEDIGSKRMLATSPMPAGLLDKLIDRESADLMAVLLSLDER